MKNLYSILILTLLLYSCGDEEPALEPASARIANAVENLRSELVAPSEGWKVRYKPTNDAGVFFMLLKFEENGDVNIQSDVPANDGEFRNQTITYRIDNSLGLELVLETYGVFHYLFELDETTFGAEFEFIYESKVGENLIFRSKTDIFDITTLIFEPAQANDDELFGIEVAQTLDVFSEIGIDDGLTRQQVFLEDRDISIFWAADLEKRNMTIEFAGIGQMVDEIINDQLVLIEQSTAYTLEGNQMILEEPISFVLNGFRNEITQITLGELSEDGPSLCSTGPNENPKTQGFSPGLGSTIVQNTGLSTSGLGFTEGVYTVNPFFIFDEEGNSLADDETNEGIIIEKFPDVVGFAFLYGVELNDPTIPIFSLGLILEDGELYFREYEPTTTEINRVKINLLDQYFFRTEPEGEPVPPNVQADLEEITDLIFQGGEIFAYDFPIEGIEVFRLLNACNDYEFFLVQ